MEDRPCQLCAAGVVCPQAEVLESAVKWIQLYYNERLLANEKAMEEARRQMEDKMNGFPEQFVKRGEVTAQMAGIVSKVEMLIEFKSRAEGLATKSSVDTVWWVAVTGITISVLGLLLRFFKV